MFEGADLRRAAVFHAVASAGGITAAARRLGKSPPAVHSELRRFERDLGVRLMERSGRKLYLTARGRVLFEAVGRALEDLDRARHRIRSAGEDQPPLRIGAVTAFARYRLMPGLTSRLPPGRPLMIRTGAQDDILRSLSRGEIDLAIAYKEVVQAPIEGTPVAVEALVLAGAAGAGSSLAEAERLAWVTYEEHEYVFGRWFSEVLGRQPRTLSRGDHFEELEEALQSVRAGRGVTIAPLEACVAHGLVELGPRCENALYLCGLGDALSSPDADLVRACLSAERTDSPEPSVSPAEA